MVENNGWKDAMLRCYLNGAYRILGAEEAQRLLWQCSIGWIVLTGFFRYKIANHGESFDITKRLTKADIIFAYELLRRRCVPVTEAELRITHGALIARAYRFTKEVFQVLGEKLYPVETCYTPVDGGTAILGYQLKRGCTCLLILGTDPSCGISDPDFDWPRLQDPPSE